MHGKVMIAAGCLGLSGCLTSPTPPTPAEVGSTYDDMVAPFNARAGFVPRDFAEAGLHAVDLRCDAFFNNLMEYDRNAAGAQGGINLLGGLVAGSQAATQETAEDIAIASLLFAGLDAQIANYREYELLGPFAGSARQFVIEARATYRTQALPTTRLGAVDYVHRYAQLCTADAIISYINAAVMRAKPVLEGSAAPILSQTERAAVVVALAAVAPEFASLSDEEWARIYVYLADIGTAPALADSFAAQLPSQRAAFLDANSPPGLTQAGTTVLRQLEALRGRSAAFVAATQNLRAERDRQQTTNRLAHEAAVEAAVEAERTKARALAANSGEEARLMDAAEQGVRNRMGAPADVGLPPASPPRTGVIVVR